MTKTDKNEAAEKPAATEGQKADPATNGESVEKMEAEIGKFEEQLANANAKNGKLTEEVAGFKQTIAEMGTDIAALRHNNSELLDQRAELLQAQAVHPEGRVLGKGTSFTLGDAIVTLAEDAVINYPTEADEQQFVGMLITSVGGDANFEANKHSLSMIYSRGSGSPVALANQPDEALRLLSDAENAAGRQTLGVNAMDVAAEIQRRKTIEPDPE